MILLLKLNLGKFIIENSYGNFIKENDTYGIIERKKNKIK